MKGKLFKTAVAVIAMIALLAGCSVSPIPSIEPEKPSSSSSESSVPVPSSSSSSSESSSVPDETEEKLPSLYDPREDGVLPEIRDQQWGICWAYGSLASLETYLIKNGYETKSVRLSAEDMLWWTNAVDTGLGWVRPRRSDGGFSAMSIGYLTTAGARYESDIPDLGPMETADDDFYGQGINVRPQRYNTVPYLYEVTDIEVYPDGTETDVIKNAIMEYGGVTASYCDDPEYFREDVSAYWHPETPDGQGNHTICVIGWDDDFDSGLFKASNDGKRPGRNGAWIVKNSYGTEYGSDGGYIYISYDDAYLFKEGEHNISYAVAGARRAAGYKKYIHDEFGAVNLYYPESGKPAIFANMFEFDSGETVREVSFYTMSKGAKYSIYYAPVYEGSPVYEPETWTVLAMGEVEHAGYTTVKVNSGAVLPYGPGAVIISLEGDNLSIGTDENMLKDGRPLFNATVSNKSFTLFGQAFLPLTVEREVNGSTITQTADACLRIYTEK